MNFIKLNFLYNSLISYIFSIELLNIFIIYIFEFHLIIDNIDNFNRSIFIILVNIKNIGIYRLF